MTDKLKTEPSLLKPSTDRMSSTRTNDWTNRRGPKRKRSKTSKAEPDQLKLRGNSSNPK